MLQFNLNSWFTFGGRKFQIYEKKQGHQYNELPMCPLPIFNDYQYMVDLVSFKPELSHSQVIFKFQYHLILPIKLFNMYF